jgi:hypothetical protein
MTAELASTDRISCMLWYIMCVCVCVCVCVFVCVCVCTSAFSKAVAGTLALLLVALVCVDGVEGKTVQEKHAAHARARCVCVCARARSIARIALLLTPCQYLVNVFECSSPVHTHECYYHTCITKATPLVSRKRLTHVIKRKYAHITKRLTAQQVLLMAAQDSLAQHSPSATGKWCVRL